jgi:hypothetical protein
MCEIDSNVPKKRLMRKNIAGQLSLFRFVRFVALILFVQWTVGLASLRFVSERFAHVATLSVLTVALNLCSCCFDRKTIATKDERNISTRAPDELKDADGRTENVEPGQRNNPLGTDMKFMTTCNDQSTVNIANGRSQNDMVIIMRKAYGPPNTRWP